MELQKTRKPKAKSQGKDTTSVFRAKPPTNAHSVLPPLQLAELESRLEQLPTDFDELPCVSAEPDTPSRVSSVKKNEQDGSTEEDVSRETSSVPKPSEPEGTESKVDEIQSAESRLATHGEESDKTTHNHLCQELEEQLSQAENLHPSIYPTVHPISGESIEKFSGMIRIEPSAGKIYPVLSDPSLNCETQLLSEAQLEAIYHNQLYENTEAFVDIFIESAEFPQDGCISELLRLYKEACCEYDRSSTESVSRENVIKDCIAGVWTAETRTVTQEGKCGDQKFATGSAKYIVASLHKDRLTELGKLFKEDTRGRMDTELSWRIRTRSLAHQLQWQIIRINNAFMFDHRVSANSQPCFIEDGGQLTSRLVLHNALSNLFFHLRFPYLPSQFRESISSWITELCATLMKACTSQDQQFILCHLLRLTSPLDWAPKLLQSFLNVPVANSRIIIDHSLAMLHILLSPVKSRDNFLRRIKEYEKEESSWAIINEDYDEV
ncbi:hypothetical protein AB6A40_008706 [Gnathostoma spinigerum]|uniref:Uncharacterized protein n=1 Tax=Gnathostoma spinigerum TaxID=75299 RepID=A0ABD6EZC0_9BILA